MPTPARRATASRLASEPPALNTALAASRTRSRLRTASARGLRLPKSSAKISATCPEPLAKRRNPPYSITTGVQRRQLRTLAAGHSRAKLAAPPNRPHRRRAAPCAAQPSSPTSQLGAQHESVYFPYREQRR